MATILDPLLGWSTPVAPRTDHAGLAAELKHNERQHDCLGRRQGRCPGLEHCHDCAWNESEKRTLSG